MPQPLPLLLIVEDDSNIRFLYGLLLKKHFRIVEAEDGESGFVRAMEVLPDFILTDHSMPRCTGAEMVSDLTTFLRSARFPSW